MSKRKLTLYECERCGKSTTEEGGEPPKWAMLSFTTNDRSQQVNCGFDSEICQECADKFVKWWASHDR